jgi:predicted CoA-binding protein
MASMESVRNLLERKRFAFVGLSTNPRDFSRQVLGEMERRGYQAVPVNPGADAIGGVPAFDRVQDIPGSVEWALVMVPASAAAEVVRDCVQAGVRRVWLHRGGGPGSVSPQALALCEDHGVEVVDGQCPLMFLEGAGFPHRLHGWFKKIGGSYPRPQHLEILG